MEIAIGNAHKKFLTVYAPTVPSPFSVECRMEFLSAVRLLCDAGKVNLQLPPAWPPPTDACIRSLSNRATADVRREVILPYLLFIFEMFLNAFIGASAGVRAVKRSGQEEGVLSKLPHERRSTLCASA
eukprot:6177306-Pleurochrysis_carterae.AAC.1